MLSAHDKNTTNERFFCQPRLSICSISSICREFRSQLPSLWRLKSVLKDLSTFFGDRKILNEHLPFIRFSEENDYKMRKMVSKNWNSTTKLFALIKWLLRSNWFLVNSNFLMQSILKIGLPLNQSAQKRIICD